MQARELSLLGIKGLGVLRKFMELISYFFFLSSFTYYLLLLVVMAEKEWITEKRQEYFQIRLLFPGLQLFRWEEYVFWTTKYPSNRPRYL